MKFSIKVPIYRRERNGDRLTENVAYNVLRVIFLQAFVWICVLAM